MSRDREGSSLADVVLQTPLTWLICALNIGIFVLAWMRDGSQGAGVDTEILIRLGASMRYYVQHGDYWRLITAVFLHANWVHLAVNTFFMFSWCAAIERTVGSGWFAFAYLTTGIGGYAVSVLGKAGPSVGASGAGYGMIAVTMAILYRREGDWGRFMSSPFVRSTLTQAVVWILAGFLLMSRMDNYAHVGGLAFGVLCGLILERRRGRHEVKWMVSLAAYILVWAGAVVASCIPGMGLGD